MASVQPLSAPAWFFFICNIDGKGRPGQETECCGTKLSPSFAELEVSLQVSAILPAFGEKLEDVG